MLAIEKGAQNVAYFTLLAAGAIAVVVLAPLVSAVAIPVFAAKAAWHWREHAAFYNKTLSDKCTREKFGRLEGQDYTRWDGKAMTAAQTNPTQKEKIHEAMGLYFHGAKQMPRHSYFSHENLIDSSFKTNEDLEWLNREFARKEKEDLLESDLKMLRAFAKALIPLIGIAWVLLTELSFGGASEVGCRVCMLGDDDETHWSWRDALVFHRANLRARLELD